MISCPEGASQVPCRRGSRGPTHASRSCAQSYPDLSFWTRGFGITSGAMRRATGHLRPKEFYVLNDDIYDNF